MKDGLPADVVIVGAGPVGLWTAIQIKLYLPHFEIVILDKYATYQRHRDLFIDKHSLLDSHCCNQFQKMIAFMQGKVATSLIETKLKDFALRLGIQFVHLKINSGEEVNKLFPHVQFVIGADGAHSVIRSSIFQDKLVRFGVQNLLEINYPVSGKADYLGTWHSKLTLLNAYRFVEESIKVDINGNSVVTLRVILNEQDYEQVKAATHNNPFIFTQHHISTINQELVSSIQSWLDSRKAVFNEQIEPATIKMHPIKSEVYMSDDVYLNHIKHCFLVGDAAIGVPFWRSLNCGLLCGTQLAKMLYQFVMHETVEEFSSFGSQVKLISPLRAYNQYVKRLAHSEARHAYLKGKIIDSGISLLNASQSSLRSIKSTAASTDEMSINSFYFTEDNIASLKLFSLSTWNYLKSFNPSSSMPLSNIDSMQDETIYKKSKLV